MRAAQIALLLLAVCAPPAVVLAQQSASPEELGLKLTAVPDALYAHLPALERGHGVLVETVKPGSRAAELGLKPYDIVLAVGTVPVKSGEALPGKLSALPQGEREVLQIIRGGKSFALTVASPATSADATYSPPKSLFKPGGPPAVSVEHKPLPNGGLEVNLFYLNPSNKMQRQALHGSLEEIERQVAHLADQGQMSESVHDLVALALKRLRAKSPPSQK